MNEYSLEERLMDDGIKRTDEPEEAELHSQLNVRAIQYRSISSKLLGLVQSLVCSFLQSLQSMSMSREGSNSYT